MSPLTEKLIEQAVKALREDLGQHLNSCCLYGSAVRGNFVEGKSDINLLVVIEASTPGVHARIGQAIGTEACIDPLVIGRKDLARTAQAFSSKFASIKQNYRVLVGADPLVGLQIDPALERFLCEQALRNLQLRMTYAFVTSRRGKAYPRFLLRCITPLFVQVSQILRLEGISVPKDFEERITLFESQFEINGDPLRQLLSLKTDDSSGAGKTDASWHEQLFPIVDAVIGWIDAHWQSK